MRQTRQRSAVAEILQQTEEFRSAQELHSALRDAGQAVGLTTVYRTLTQLAQAKEVDVLIGDDGEARYRACSSAHHHHVVCRSCGYTVEVTAAPVERWAHRTAAELGFTDVTHTVEIAGICDTCANLTNGS